MNTEAALFLLASRCMDVKFVRPGGAKQVVVVPSCSSRGQEEQTAVGCESVQNTDCSLAERLSQEVTD